MRSELKLSPRLLGRGSSSALGGSGTVESRRAPGMDRAPGDSPRSVDSSLPWLRLLTGELTSKGIDASCITNISAHANTFPPLEHVSMRLDALSDEQLAIIKDGAAPLERRDRAGYFEHVAALLRECDKWPSNRAVSDIVQTAQRVFNRALTRAF